VAGGALFFVGGGMHPGQDPADVDLKEHMRLMFEDPGWYPSHAVLAAGMALITAGLALLVRRRALAGVPRVHTAAAVAAITGAIGTVSMVLHLVAATEADRIADGRSTPLVDVNNGLETFAVPAFGLSIAVLAVLGASTRSLGNWPAAVLGVLGGVGYALAGATFLFTDALDPLFPLAAGIALWALIAGIGLLRGARVPTPAVPAAA
jgi:hypothetical protein